MEGMEAEHHGVKYGKYIERFKGPETVKTEQLGNGSENGNPASEMIPIDEGSDSTTAVVESIGSTTTVVEVCENTNPVVADPKRTDFSFEGEEEIFKARSWRAYLAPTPRSA